MPGLDGSSFVPAQYSSPGLSTGTARLRRWMEREIVSLNYDEKLQSITAVCARANPDFAKRTGPGASIHTLAAQTRLADVSLALLLDCSWRRSDAVAEALQFWWNLGDDSLARQSDECVGFLFDRLREVRF